MQARKWAADTRNKLRQSASQFRKGKLTASRVKTVYIPNKNNPSKSFRATEMKLKNSFKYRLKNQRGNRGKLLSFTLAYHGFFVEKGYGKGRRTPKPWFNPVMEKQLNTLADETLNQVGNAALKAIKF